MNRNARVCALAFAALAATALAETPGPGDFAHGLYITPAPGRPAQQFALPDRVYQGVTRTDLGDLRVFNSGNVAVPHALCAAAALAPEGVRQESLGVFPVNPGARRLDGGNRVAVQTPNGTLVSIVEAPVHGIAASGGGYVMDATAIRDPLRALHLQWFTEDGASEAQVRVESSEDLGQWSTVVATAALLRVTADGRALDLSRIELPLRPYKYLRLTRGDGSQVRITSAAGEIVVPARPAEPFWFTAASSPDAAADEFRFDTGRRAPVESARVRLPIPNMILQVALDSRTSTEAPWQPRWSGESRSVETVNVPAVHFAAVTDPHWRLRVLRGAESLGDRRPRLELGYHPAQLRFLAQGPEPFVLAYGSARVPPAQRPDCGTLLGPMPDIEQASLIGTAVVVAAPDTAFGGAAALTPPPKPTPVRQVVLWIVLVLGTAVVVGMAVALLRRLREHPGPS